MGSNGFFPGHVIYICSGDAEAAVFGLEAANATASGFDGGKVVRRRRVAQVDSTLGGDCVSEPLWPAMISIDEDGIGPFDKAGKKKKKKKRTLPPLTAVREGHTQSNMSAPKAMETTRSSGYPTPMT